jgi:hypothetical protein
METIRDKGHSDRVIRKCERIAGLKALLKEWELSDNLDRDYIRGLKARLLSVKNQLKNMCGHDGLEENGRLVVSEQSRKRHSAKRDG